jgi:hypothetical protein
MRSCKTSRLVLASLTCLALAGCGKQLTALNEIRALQEQIAKQYGEKGVNVNLNNDRYLTVTFINSPLNSKSSEERAQRAQDTASFVTMHYPSIVKLNELWVVFQQQEKRYIVVTYSKPIDYYGFDRKGLPLPNLKERGYEASAQSALHPTVLYSPAQRQTNISIDRLQLEGDETGGFVLAPHFKMAGDATGKTSSDAPDWVALDFASSSSISMFPGASPIAFVADDKVVYQATARFARSISNDGRYSEQLLMRVPYPLFRRLAAAKKLIFRIGDREYIVNAAHRAALHEMTEYVKE